MSPEERVRIIMLVKQYDIAEARRLLAEIHALCPWWELPQAVKQQLETTK
jgi:hypothetical protein